MKPKKKIVSISPPKTFFIAITLILLFYLSIHISRYISLTKIRVINYSNVEQPISLTINDRKSPYPVDYGASSEYFVYRRELQEVLVEFLEDKQKQLKLPFDSNKLLKRKLNTILIIDAKDSLESMIFHTKPSPPKHSQAIRFVNFYSEINQLTYNSKTGIASSGNIKLPLAQITDYKQIESKLYDIKLFFDDKNKISFTFYPEEGEYYSGILSADSEGDIHITIFVDNPPGDNFITPILKR